MRIYLRIIFQTFPELYSLKVCFHELLCTAHTDTFLAKDLLHASFNHEPLPIFTQLKVTVTTGAQDHQHGINAINLSYDGHHLWVILCMVLSRGGALICSEGRSLKIFTSHSFELLSNFHFVRKRKFHQNKQ